MPKTSSFVAFDVSSEPLRRLFNSIPLPLAIIGEDAEIREANPAFIDMINPRACSGDAVSLAECIAQEDLDELRRQMSEVRKGQKTYFHQETRFRPDDEKTVWGEMTGLLVGPAGDDGPERWLTFVVDTTEHKGTEQKLERSTRLHALGELAGGVAHDFNNVLGIVITYTEMLQMRLSDQGDREIDIWLQKLHAAVERGRTLTHQLLTFSHDHHAQREQLEINEVVRELVELVGRIIGANIELEVELEPGLPPLAANPSQMEQVLMNLVVNARDAMPDGGRLTIGTRCETASFADLDSGSGEDEWIVLEVRDTGHGMDQKTQDKVFEPFFTTKKKGEGTGLGLATVYGIVDNLGGHIRIDSEPGRGTAMSLYLPAQQDCEQSAKPTAEPSHKPQRTILLVEDQDDLREPFCDYLSAQGYEVHGAASVAEAVERHEAIGGVEVLVTDIVLHDGSGLDLEEQLAAHSPNMNVIFLSGYVPKMRKDVGEHATRVYLPKPIGLSELDNAIAGLFDDN